MLIDENTYIQNIYLEQGRPMYKLILFKGDMVVYDRADKDFRSKYGSMGEQVGVVKDDASISVIVERLKKTYAFNDIIYDCHIKKKTGWKYFTPEQKELVRAKMRAAKLGKKYSQAQRDAMAAAKIGKRSNFAGHQLSEQAKATMALRKLGNTHSRGTRWAHHVETFEEIKIKAGAPLPPNFVYGRDPSKGLGGSWKFKCRSQQLEIEDE